MKTGTDRSHQLVSSLSLLMTLFSANAQIRHRLLDNHENEDGKTTVGMGSYALAQGCWQDGRLRVSITSADIGILDYVCDTEALRA